MILTSCVSGQIFTVQIQRFAVQTVNGQPVTVIVYRAVTRSTNVNQRFESLPTDSLVRSIQHALARFGCQFCTSRKVCYR